MIGMCEICDVRCQDDPVFNPSLLDGVRLSAIRYVSAIRL
jgi:hypothetical protein